ncbi:MAG: hypothetical protein R6V77_06540 [Candidatus Cloacimonadaceae bacterium]
MKDTLFVVGKIIGLLIFILAFSLLGIVSGRPIMILAYAGFFVVVMGIIFLFVRKNQRHFEIISQRSHTVSKIIGIVMLLAAIAIPALAISSMQLFELNLEKMGFGVIAIIIAITIALMAGVIFGVYLINKKGSTKINKVIGYLIIIILSAVPALLVIPHDKTTTGIGSVYYVAVLVAVLSWWGLSLYLNKE